MKEWIRKRIVAIKRQPSIIPTVLLIISCLIFNLNLTDFSETTSLIYSPGMGIALFVITLFSILSIITYLSAYPKRQKPKYMSIIITILMVLVSIGCQIFFYNLIIQATEYREKPIKITDFIITTKKVIIIHIIMLSITFVSLVTLPVYKKLLNKINTSIVISENQIDNVEVEEEIE